MVAQLKGMDKSTWAKPARKGPNKNIPRVDIMLGALGNFKILLTNNTEVLFKNNVENREKLEIFKAGENDPKTQLRTEAMTYVAMKDIVKTAVFGGGGGAADANAFSPTKMTEMFESLQCLYCAAMTSRTYKRREDVTTKILERAQQRVFMNRNTAFKDVVSLDDSWHASSYYVAKGLIKNNYITSSYTFHRDDPIMNSIYEAKSRAFKNNNIANLNNDKWNPGDIWAIKNKNDVAKILEEADTSVLKINDVVMNAFFDKTIIGISLKKVIDEKKMKVSVQNDNKARATLTKHTIEGLQISGAKTMFSMQGGFISIENNQKIDVRPPNVEQSLNMEMILSTARGGKAGQGPQIDAAKRFMNYTYPDNKQQKLENNALVDKDTRAIDKLWKMIEEIQKSPLCKDKIKVDEKTFKAELNNQERNVIHAKKAVAHVFLGIVRANKKQRDQFVDYVVNYASSTLPDSSVYLKVYQ